MIIEIVTMVLNTYYLIIKSDKEKMIIELNKFKSRGIFMPKEYEIRSVVVKHVHFSKASSTIF